MRDIYDLHVYISQTWIDRLWPQQFYLVCENCGRFAIKKAGTGKVTFLFSYNVCLKVVIRVLCICFRRSSDGSVIAANMSPVQYFCSYLLFVCLLVEFSYILILQMESWDSCFSQIMTEQQTTLSKTIGAMEATRIRIAEQVCGAFWGTWCGQYALSLLFLLYFYLCIGEFTVAFSRRSVLFYAKSDWPWWTPLPQRYQLQ